MKIYEYLYDYTNISFSFISDDTEKILYFDIETTGLNPKYSDLYMIGYGFQVQKQFKIILLFNDDGCSEPEMLAYFNKQVSSFEYLVTYNGDMFDIPYILEKYSQFEQQTDISRLNSYDIYRIMRPFKKLLHLNSMKQHDLEDLLDYRRSEFIPGGDLIKEYRAYLTSGSEHIQNHLLCHNRDDIDGLIRITNILALHEIYSGKFDVLKMNQDENQAVFVLQVPRLPFRLTYGHPNLYLNGRDTELNVRIPVQTCKLKHYFDDYRNYYYLPLEDTAIHKSIAEYVDSDYKKKATKATAYCWKEGTFLPQSHPPVDLCYKRDIHEKESFLLLSRDFQNNPDAQKEYIWNLLKAIR